MHSLRTVDRNCNSILLLFLLVSCCWFSFCASSTLCCLFEDEDDRGIILDNWSSCTNMDLARCRYCCCCFWCCPLSSCFCCVIFNNRGGSLVLLRNSNDGCPTLSRVETTTMANHDRECIPIKTMMMSVANDTATTLFFLLRMLIVPLAGRLVIDTIINVHLTNQQSIHNGP